MIKNKFVIVIALSIYLLTTFNGPSASAKPGDTVTQKNSEVNYVLFDPLAIFLGSFKVGYEYQFDRGSQGIFVYPYVRYTNFGGYDIRGGGAEFQYRFYLGEKSQQKSKEPFYKQTQAYMGPFARFKYAKHMKRERRWDSDSYKNTSYYTHFDGGITIGIQTPVARYFILDFYFGGGFRYTIAEGSNSRTGLFTPGYSGVIPKLGVSIGTDF